MLALALLGACTPTVRLEAPKDPIMIQLDVRIQQEVRIMLERDVEELLTERSDIF